jgi:hypothetical protein
MTRLVRIVLPLFVFSLIAAPSLAADGPIETFVKGCEKELTAYCKDVTPGEGRLLACLYAHNDKVSVRCELAIYDAAVQLDRAITVLTYVAGECRDDLYRLCGDVAPGEGRLLDCLDKKAEQVSARCKKAVKEVTE